MPLIEAGFITDDGLPDVGKLIFYGPTMAVTVGHYDPDNQLTATPATSPKTVFALIDSGAGESCIDEDLANELGLPVIDTCITSGVSGANEHNVYMAQISIPGLDFSQFGRFTGVKLKSGGQEHEVLLGRTFLSQTVMIYDGIRGQVTLASAKRT